MGSWLNFVITVTTLLLSTYYSHWLYFKTVGILLAS